MLRQEFRFTGIISLKGPFPIPLMFSQRLRGSDNLLLSAISIFIDVCVLKLYLNFMRLVYIVLMIFVETLIYAYDFVLCSLFII